MRIIQLLFPLLLVASVSSFSLKSLFFGEQSPEETHEDTSVNENADVEEISEEDSKGGDNEESEEEEIEASELESDEEDEEEEEREREREREGGR